MIKEVVILVGGLGERLKSVVKDVPKPLASVNGRPFLWYIVNRLLQEDVRRIILSAGYKADLIKEFVLKFFPRENIEIVVEKELLGTGGALKFSLSFIYNDHFFFLNGDSFFDISLRRFEKDSFSKDDFDISMALSEAENPERFGVVETDEHFNVIGFKEKGLKRGKSYINAGVYIISKKVIKNYLESFPNKFSFEKDVLEKLELKTVGIPYKADFIDIGMPQDYLRAEKLFKN